MSNEEYYEKRKYVIDMIGKDGLGFIFQGFEYAEKCRNGMEVVELLYKELKEGLEEE